MTNGLRIASELAGCPGIAVVLPGGWVRWEALSVVGTIGSGVFDRINVQTAFVGAAGFTFETGLSDATEEEAQIKRSMIEVAREVFAIVDHTKWGHTAFATFCRTEELTGVISDRSAPELMVTAPEARGIEISLVPYRHRSGGRWCAHPVIPSRPGSRRHADIDVIAARLSRRKEDQRDPRATNASSAEINGARPAGSCDRGQLAKRRKSMDLTRMRRAIVLTAMTALVVTACSSGGSASPSAAASAASTAAASVAPTASPEPSAAAVTLEYLVDDSQANQQLAKAFADCLHGEAPERHHQRPEPSRRQRRRQPGQDQARHR